LFDFTFWACPQEDQCLQQFPQKKIAAQAENALILMLYQAIFCFIDLFD